MVSVPYSDHAVRLAGGIDGLPHRGAEIGRHVDFETQLAGEADAKQQHRYAADPAACDAMCGSAAALRSMPSTRDASTRRAFGPCTAITAHCSVVEVSHTLSSGHSVWR